MSIKKIIHRLKWTFFTRTGAKETIINTEHGFKFIVRFSSGSAFLLYFGKYEIEEIDLIKKFVKPGMTVFDIGANVGYISLLMANLIGSNGKLFSFEPNPNIYSLLNENIEINPILNDGRIITEQIALSTSDDKMKFFCPIEGHEGLGGLKDTKRAPLEKVIEVNVKKLDDYVTENNIKNIDFIKMDVEGGELDVIKGGLKTIETMKPIILFEATDLNTTPYNYKVKDLILFLEEFGYNVKATDSENFIAIPEDG
ncbi:MAG: FkbM family methyltransferase [Candidatus Methanofastidiosum sp.]|nr:FkbM family methyltransferase [Methanofastidiosum sp.]